MQPTILALDTATDACSVALCTGNQTFEAFVVQPQAHSKLLLDMINDVCIQAGIVLAHVDAIAFGRGPGSFTGVRIAASVVQGLGFGLQKPVIAVSSLQALAQQAANVHDSKNILALIDARMHEVYWATFDNVSESIVVPKMADSLQKPDDLELDQSVNYLAIGTGATAYAGVLQQKYPRLQFDNTIQYPRAQEVLQIAIEKFRRGEVLPSSEAIPMYVRNDVTQTSKKNPD